MPAGRLEVVFVGLQAAGTTSCSRSCSAAVHEHISKDAWLNAGHRAAPPAAAPRRGGRELAARVRMWHSEPSR